MICALRPAPWKKNGGKNLDGAHAHQREFAELWNPSRKIRDLIARTAFTQLRYSFLLLVATLAGLFVTYLLGVDFLFHSGRSGDGCWRGTAISIMTATYGATVRFLRPPVALGVDFAVRGHVSTAMRRAFRHCVTGSAAAANGKAAPQAPR